MRIEVGVGDLVQRTGDGEAHVRYSVAGRSRGQVTLYAVYTVHKKMRNTVSWFSLKTKVDGFSRFGLKIGAYGFCVLASKPLTRVSPVWASKQAGAVW
jgi:hypothetical protein